MRNQGDARWRVSQVPKAARTRLTRDQGDTRWCVSRVLWPVLRHQSSASLLSARRPTLAAMVVVAKCLSTLTGEFARMRRHFLQILPLAVQLAVEGTGFTREQAIASGTQTISRLGLQISHSQGHHYLNRPAARLKMLRRQYRESRLLDRLDR